MRILVVLASSNRVVCQTFSERKGKIVSANCLPKDLSSVATIAALVYNPLDTKESLDQFLLSAFEDADAVAVLLDDRHQALITQYQSALFIGIANLSSYIDNVSNVLSGLLSRLLRNLGHLVILLQDLTRLQAAVLPIRNFHGPELRRLVEVCSDLSMNGQFSNELRLPLSSLLARRGPKRRSKFPERYFKDDRQLYFRYGHEEHSTFETGGTHRHSCHITGLYRFGLRLERARHFNVTCGDSDNDRITTEFRNCHDQDVQILNRSHVNMFSNDFHK